MKKQVIEKGKGTRKSFYYKGMVEKAETAKSTEMNPFDVVGNGEQISDSRVKKEGRKNQFTPIS